MFRFISVKPFTTSTTFQLELCVLCLVLVTQLTVVAQRILRVDLSCGLAQLYITLNTRNILCRAEGELQILVISLCVLTQLYLTKSFTFRG